MSPNHYATVLASAIVIISISNYVQPAAVQKKAPQAVSIRRTQPRSLAAPASASGPPIIPRAANRPFFTSGGQLVMPAKVANQLRPFLEDGHVWAPPARSYDARAPYPERAVGGPYRRNWGDPRFPFGGGYPGPTIVQPVLPVGVPQPVAVPVVPAGIPPMGMMPGGMMPGMPPPGMMGGPPIQPNSSPPQQSSGPITINNNVGTNPSGAGAQPNQPMPPPGTFNNNVPVQPPQIGVPAQPPRPLWRSDKDRIVQLHFQTPDKAKQTEARQAIKDAGGYVLPDTGDVIRGVVPDQVLRKYQQGCVWCLNDEKAKACICNSAGISPPERGQIDPNVLPPVASPIQLPDGSVAFSGPPEAIAPPLNYADPNEEYQPVEYAVNPGLPNLDRDSPMTEE